MTGAFTIGSPNRTKETPLSRDVGLVGYWKFDEESGTIAYDSSGYGNHGTINLSILKREILFSGETVLYKNTSNYAGADVASNNAFNVRDGITVMAWTKMIDLGHMSWIGRLNGWTDGWLLYSNSETQRLWGVSANQTSFVRGQTDLQNNRWYFFGGIHNLSTGEMKYFIDGTFGASNWPSNVSLNVINAGLGFLYQNRQAQIDNIRIYNRALSASEISQIYNATKSRY